MVATNKGDELEEGGDKGVKCLSSSSTVNAIPSSSTSTTLPHEQISFPSSSSPCQDPPPSFLSFSISSLKSMFGLERDKLSLSRKTKTILYFMTIHFCIAFTDVITTAPLIRLFEGSLCEVFYGVVGGGIGVMGIEEGKCKVKAIQRELAGVRGVKGGLDMLPVLLVAIPLSKLGTRIGRRKIMGLSIIGVIASLVEVYVVCAFPKILPLKLVWLSSILLLCGGGLNTATAFMYSMASECFSDEDRSQGYYYIFSAFYIAELIASFTAGMTIDISPWIPCGLALASMVICLILLIFVSPPSSVQSLTTNKITAASQITSAELDPDTTNQTYPTDQPEEEAHESQSLLKPTHTHTHTHKRKKPQTLLQIITSNKNMALIIPIFLVGVYRYTTLNIVIQYASVRFGIKISSGALFYTETAVVNIVLFLGVLPRVVEWVKRGDGRGGWGWRGDEVDLGIVRISLTFLCVGSLGIAISGSERLLPIAILLFALGFGSSVSALSLISHWVGDAEKATVYAAVVVLQSLGHVVGDPLLMGVYSWGLGKGVGDDGKGDGGGGKGGMGDGKGWQAAPFYVISGLYALALLSASFIRLDGKTCAEGEDENDSPIRSGVLEEEEVEIG